MSRKQTIQSRQSTIKKLFIEQLKKTPTIEQSSQKVGVSRMTILRWRKASKKFDIEVDEALREGREFVSDLAETQMFSLISQGKSEMIKYFLSHNNPRYTNKLEINGSVRHEHRELTKEQKQLVRNALRLAGLNTKSYGSKKENKKR